MCILLSNDAKNLFRYGRKKGTLAYTALYSIGALSTKSLLLPVLMLGRFVNGIGTSLLFSAPESWLVGEANKDKDGSKYLGETFGLVCYFYAIPKISYF